MLKVIIDGIFKLMLSVASIFTAPISAVLNEYVPSIGVFVESITNMLSYVVSFFGWFWFLVPTTTRFVIISILSFYLTITPLRVLLHSISRGLDVIKRLNIFSGK